MAEPPARRLRIKQESKDLKRLMQIRASRFGIDGFAIYRIAKTQASFDSLMKTAIEYFSESTFLEKNIATKFIDSVRYEQWKEPNNFTFYDDELLEIFAFDCGRESILTYKWFKTSKNEDVVRFRTTVLKVINNLIEGKNKRYPKKKLSIEKNGKLVTFKFRVSYNESVSTDEESEEELESEDEDQ